MSISEHYLDLKDKRQSVLDELQSLKHHYVHPLETVTMSGQVTFTEDQRAYLTGTGTALEKITTLDLDPLVPLSRKTLGNYPVYDNFSIQTVSAGEFAMGHATFTPWTVNCFSRPHSSYADIGEQVTNTYKRTSITDPWSFFSTSTTTISGRIDLTMSGGGFDASGGKGTSSEEEKIFIRCRVAATPSLGYGPVFPLQECYRLPWDRTWASESDYYDAVMSDWISYQNGIYGSGFSGTTTARAYFLNSGASRTDFSASTNSMYHPTR